MELFSPIQRENVKLAGRRLAVDPNSWPAEITNHLYRDHPYLMEYTFEPEFRSTDQDTGTAVGHLSLSSGPGLRDGLKTAHLLIPIIIKKGELYPLDVFLESDKARPLTKQAFESAVLTPVLGEKPGRGGDTDQSLLASVWPPSYQRYGGFGGGPAGAMGAGGNKTASVNYAVKTASDGTKVSRFGRHTAVMQRPKKAAQVIPIPVKAAELVKKAAASHVVEEKPKGACQVVKLAEGTYQVTAAVVAEGCLDPKVWKRATTSRPHVRGLLGERIAELDKVGYVNLFPEHGEGAIEGLFKDAELLTIQMKGEWEGMRRLVLVKGKDGRHLQGVIYRCCYLEDRVDSQDREAKEKKTPGGGIVTGRPYRKRAHFLWTNGSEYAMEDDIVAVRMSEERCDDRSEWKMPPSGHGFFLRNSDAYGPVSITGKRAHKLGKGYTALLTSGRSILMIPHKESYQIERVEEGVYTYPKSWGWLHTGTKMTSLQGSIEGFTKSASLDTCRVAKLAADTYALWVGGKETGGAMDRRSMEVMLGLMGYATDTVKMAMDRVNRQEVYLTSPALPGSNRPIADASHLKRTTVLELRDELFPAGVSKQAAMGGIDADTVDAMLELEVLTPETFDQYVDCAGHFEETAEKCAEMLLAVRLGMSDVSEGHLKRAMVSLQRVSEGLKSLELESARKRETA